MAIDQHRSPAADTNGDTGEFDLVTWHAVPADAVFTLLATSMNGLKPVEAQSRLRAHGRNELVESQPIRPLAIFIRQLKNPLVLILLVAGAISGFLGDRIDSFAILGIVVLNSVIGFYQEFNAEKAIAALRKITAPRARVKRDGQESLVPAADVVPGDVILLHVGDLVPADARLIEAHCLACVESALTGESEAATKQAGKLPASSLPPGDRTNMVFMGTTVAAGTGLGIVVSTGMETEIGRIAELIEEAEKEETPMQKQLQAFGRSLVWASLAIVGLLFLLGLLRGLKPFELFMTSVSLAAAAVPEGLPAVVTLALAMGVLRMSRRGALVRRLPAVETLGETGVVCTDKTGTLTVGEMTVRVLEVAGETFEVTGEGYTPTGKILAAGQVPHGHQTEHLRELLTIMAGCNDARLVEAGGSWTVLGSPTEGALLTAAAKHGITRERIDRAQRKVHEISFDSERKLMTVVRRLPDNSCRALVKGAPEALLDRCSQIYAIDGIRPMTPEDRQHILSSNSALALRRLRILGGACRQLQPDELEEINAGTTERDLIFVGLVGMHDPPRAEAKAAVQHCRDAGIRVVMITGDHPKTAQAIAAELGIAGAGDDVLTGMELEQMTDAVLRQRALTTNLYARVTAQHKLRLVHALKADGAIVAMTGDGANDAPALKGADIGVAMGRTGTEVSRQAADMVITDDNFATIVAAVEQGRGIHANIRKTILYLLAGNMGELLLMFICILMGLPLPLLPIHLLWINLITDGLPALALATDPLDVDVMKRSPQSSRAAILGRNLFSAMALTGFLSAGVSLAVYWHGLKFHGEAAARTGAFTTLVFAELLRAFGCRSETRPLWQTGWFCNLNLVLVVTISVFFQIVILRSGTVGHLFKTTVVSWPGCLGLMAVAAVPAAVLEVMKMREDPAAFKKGQELANSRQAEKLRIL